MNSIDITITIIILIGIVRGFIRGFIFELAVLGSIVVCYFLGFKLADKASVYIEKVIHVNPETLHYVSLLIVWIGIAWYPVAPAGRPPPSILAGEFAG